jgi:hypothetical protein
MMKKKWIGAVAITSLGLLAALGAGPAMSKVENPKYTVITSQGDIEIRQYAPMIAAQVQVKGERKEAIEAGFRLLADYIFGNNMAQQKIAMTAPVQQESTKIAMTAPVAQQYVGGSWQVSFVMPAQYTMDTIPKPVNNRVVLTALPAKKMAVIRFNGRGSEKNLQHHTEKLREYTTAKNLVLLGSPTYAFYNPPWTLPPLRRNEVMVEIL